MVGVGLLAIGSLSLLIVLLNLLGLGTEIEAGKKLSADKYCFLNVWVSDGLLEIEGLYEYDMPPQKNATNQDIFSISPVESIVEMQWVVDWDSHHFDSMVGATPTSIYKTYWLDFSIPLPYLAAFFILISLPFWLPLLFHRNRKRYREKSGLCLHCGYDLRKTTADKCPECGADRPLVTFHRGEPELVLAESAEPTETADSTEIPETSEASEDTKPTEKTES